MVINACNSSTRKVEVVGVPVHPQLYRECEASLMFATVSPDANDFSELRYLKLFMSLLSLLG